MIVCTETCGGEACGGKRLIDIMKPTGNHRRSAGFGGICRRDTVVEDSWTILEPKPLPRAVPVGMRMLGQLKVNGVLVLVLGLAE